VEWVGSLGANVVDGTMAVGINFSNLNPSAGIVEEYIDGNDTYTGPTTIGSGCYFIMYSPTFYSPITNNGLLEFKGGCNDYAGITNNNRLVFSSPTTITVYGVISGTGYINVWSPTVFQAVNTYTGATYIQSTLTLAGNASIADSYYVGISPGDSLIYAESAGFTETEANQQLAGAGTIVDDSSPNSTINYQAIDAAFLASGGSFQNNTGNPSALLF
jgi:hypothetical protein